MCWLSALTVVVGCNSTQNEPPAAVALTTTGSTPHPSTTLAANDGCDRPTPSSYDDVGTVHTIVPQPDARLLEIEVVASPSVVCPGATVNISITVHNIGTHDVTFAPARGLLLVSHSMPKWQLASMDPVRLEAGEEATVAIQVTIPDARPGRYIISPEGYDGGAIEVVNS